jgi:predicted transposase YbfD/YdcC
MKLKERLQKVRDPRGKQGQDYQLWAILNLIIVGFLCGRRGLRAVFRLGRSLNATQRSKLGFVDGRTPCHGTFTETLRILAAEELIAVLECVVAASAEGGDIRHISIDGKTMRATKNEKGHAAHVLSAFCSGLKNIIGTKASHSKGMEIPDALKLLDELDLTDKIVTGDAMFCQHHITEKIVEKGGDYLFPVKKNQKTLFENIETAFKEPVFPPQELRQRHDESARQDRTAHHRRATRSGRRHSK